MQNSLLRPLSSPVLVNAACTMWSIFAILFVSVNAVLAFSSERNDNVRVISHLALKTG